MEPAPTTRTKVEEESEMKKNSQFFKTTAALCLAGFLAVTSLAACSVKTNVDGTSDPNGPFKAVDPSGVWANDCYYENGAYISEKVTIKDGAFSDEVKVFTNSACSGTPYFNDTKAGTYVIGGPAQYEISAVNVDITMPDTDGKMKTFYSIVAISGDYLYLPTYQGNNPESRPHYVTYSRAYKRVGN